MKLKKGLAIKLIVVIALISFIGIAYVHINTELSRAVESIDFDILSVGVTVIDNHLKLTSSVCVKNRSPYDITIKNVYIMLEGIPQRITSEKTGFKIKGNSEANVIAIFTTSPSILKAALQKLLMKEDVRLLVVAEVEGSFSIAGFSVSVPYQFEREMRVPHQIVKLPTLVKLDRIMVNDTSLITTVSVDNPTIVPIEFINGTFKIKAFDKVVAQGNILPCVLEPQRVGHLSLNITQLSNITSILEAGELEYIIHASVRIADITLDIVMKDTVGLQIDLSLSSLGGTILDIVKIDDRHILIKLAVSGSVSTTLIDIRELPIVNATFDIYANQTYIGKGYLSNETKISVTNGKLNGTAYLLVETDLPVDQLVEQLRGKYVELGVRSIKVKLNIFGQDIIYKFKELRYLMLTNVSFRVVDYSITLPQGVPPPVVFNIRVEIFNGLNWTMYIDELSGEAYDEKGVFLGKFNYTRDNVEAFRAGIRPGRKVVIVLSYVIENETLIDYIKQHYVSGSTLEMNLVIKNITVKLRIMQLELTVHPEKIIIPIVVPNVPL